MSRSILPLFLLAALLLAACASIRADSPASSQKVQISPYPRAGCQNVGNLAVQSSSRDTLEFEIRKEAASMGANYVHVTKLRVGSVTGKAKATGVALRCPQEKTEDSAPGDEKPTPPGTEDEESSLGQLQRADAPQMMPEDEGGALP